MSNQWQRDLEADGVPIVSDAEHHAQWDAKVQQQQQEDLRHAQRLALQYTKAQLVEYEKVLERSTSPHREAVLRHCRLAISIREKQGEAKW